MRALWWAIVADFHREYRIDALAIAELPAWHFDLLLAGLSPEAMYRHAQRNRPQPVTSAEQVASVSALARR